VIQLPFNWNSGEEEEKKGKDPQKIETKSD
jgi:hypothetical protein